MTPPSAEYDASSEQLTFQPLNALALLFRALLLGRLTRLLGARSIVAFTVQMPAEHHRHRDDGDIEELLPDIRGSHARTPIRSGAQAR